MEYYTYEKNYNDYDEIIPNLYIGNMNSLKDSNKFGFIVNCTDDIPFPKTCYSCIRIAIVDSPLESDNLLIIMKRNSVLEKIHDFVRNKNPVLVHCYAGIQRSCAVVACYLMKYYNIAPDTVISHIKMKRRRAFEGGVNFQRALNIFYKENVENNYKLKY